MPVISPGPVPGSTVLPAGFGHPHASEQAREIVPGQPDRGWVDDWLHRSHLNFWARTR